jgi:hypothetical protein
MEIYYNVRGIAYSSAFKEKIEVTSWYDYIRIYWDVFSLWRAEVHWLLPAPLQRLYMLTTLSDVVYRPRGVSKGEMS